MSLPKKKQAPPFTGPARTAPLTIRKWLADPIPAALPPLDPELVRLVEENQFTYKGHQLVPNWSDANSVFSEGALVAVKEATWKTAKYPIHIRNGKLYTTGDFIVYRSVNIVPGQKDRRDYEASTTDNGYKCLWVLCDCKKGCLDVFDRTTNPGAVAKNPLPEGSKCFLTFRALHKYLTTDIKEKLVLMYPQVEDATVDGLEKMVGRVRQAPKQQETPPKPTPTVPAAPVEEDVPEAQAQRFPPGHLDVYEKLAEVERALPKQMTGADCFAKLKIAHDTVQRHLQELDQRKQAEIAAAVGPIYQENQVLNADLAASRTKYAEDMAKAADEIAETRAANQRLAETERKKDADIIRLVNDEKLAKEETDRWKKKWMDQEKRINLLQEQYDSLRRASQGPQQWDVEVAKFQRGRDEAIAARERTTAELQAATAKIADLERLATSPSLSGELAQAKATSQRLEQELAAANVRISDLEKRPSIVPIQAENARLATELQTARTAMESAQATSREIQARLDEKIKENETLTAQVFALTTQLEAAKALQKDSTAHQEAIRLLEKQLEETQSALATALESRTENKGMADELDRVYHMLEECRALSKRGLDFDAPLGREEYI